jgi:LDH2 family malate/lactate/ureidoglycolate dehydrogenase
MRELRESPRVPGQERIHTAGEKEYYNTQKVMAEGVEITPPVGKGLKALQDELKFEAPDLGF